MSRKRERRVSPRSPRNYVVLMAEADNWVMVRHPHCIPFCITRREWDLLPSWPQAQDVAS